MSIFGGLLCVEIRSQVIDEFERSSDTYLANCFLNIKIYFVDMTLAMFPGIDSL